MLHALGRVGEIGDVLGGVLYLESAPFVSERDYTSTAARVPDIDPGNKLMQRHPIALLGTGGALGAPSNDLRGPGTHIDDARV